jgi:hypothetical protein
LKSAYFIALIIASFFLGWYVEVILNQFGYIPNSGSVISTICLVGFAFAAVQLAFLGSMKLFQPTQTNTVYGVEIFSFTPVVLFLPILAGIQIPWPNPTLKKLELIVLLCAFAGIHGVSKLATFYAFLQGQLGTRKMVPYWFGSSLLCAVLAIWLVNMNLKSIEAARPIPDTKVSTIQIGEEWANGIELQEGASMSREYTLDSPASIRFLWAPTQNFLSDKMYVTFNFYGVKDTNYTTSANLYTDRWSSTTVPHTAVPNGCYRYDVYWTHEAEPNWVNIFKIRPVNFASGSDRAPNMVWASGPFELPFDERMSNYNLIFLVLEGLGSNHVSEFGYERMVTPNIDSLAKQSTTHLNGINSEIELPAFMNLLLITESGRENGIPSSLEANGYATASFTELENDPDSSLNNDSFVNDFGFQWTNQFFSPKGSLDTLQLAEEWIHDNRQNNFMVLIRMSELVHERINPNYKQVFPIDGSEKDIDRFDNTLLSLDRGVGTFIQYIKGQPFAKRTIIVLTSPYGQEFSLGSSRRKLERKSNRTPIIVNIPGQTGRTRSKTTNLGELHSVLKNYLPL